MGGSGRGEEIRREVERREGGGLEMRNNKTCTYMLMWRHEGVMGMGRMGSRKIQE
jgi:hypothetical protein